MKVKLPAAAPKNPLTTPDIIAKHISEYNHNLTLILYLILEIKGNIRVQISCHSSYFNGIYEVEESCMETLQKTIRYRLHMSKIEAIEWTYI